MIVIKDVSKKYKQEQIYNNLNLELGSNCGIITLWGLSGSGKTTLINLIMGYESCDSGAITIDGISNLDINAQKQIALVKQDLGLFENISLRANLQIVSSDNKLIDMWLSVFELNDHQSKLVKNLSGGQQKRVAIIRALLKKPKVLICDEPTNGLDQENYHILMTAIEKIQNDGVLVIIATHDSRVFNVSTTRLIIENNNITVDKVVTVDNNTKKHYDQNQNDDISLFKTFKSILKNQKRKYINKLSVITIVSFLFLLIYFIFFSAYTEYKNIYFDGISDSAIVLDLNKVKQPYFEDDQLGDINYTPERLGWSKQDVEDVKAIDGVEDVVVGNENTNFIADQAGNSYTHSFKTDDYKQLFSNSVALTSAPATITLSLNSVSIPSSVFAVYQGGNTRGLDIVYGQFPDDGTNQILIPDFVGIYVMNENSLASLDEVIDTNLALSVVDENGNNKTVNYPIAGIYSTDSNKTIDTEYTIYESYHEEDLGKRAIAFTNDVYDQSKQMYESQSEEYQDYFKETYSSKEAFAKANGYYMPQLFITIDPSKVESITIELESLYPNLVIISQYSYKTDANDIGSVYQQMQWIRVGFIIGIGITFGLIIYMIQKGYYLSKRKDYALLYSLNYSKLSIFKLMIFEHLLDIVCVFVVSYILLWMLHFIPVQLFAKVMYFSLTPLSMITFIIFLIVVNGLTILLNLGKLRMNKLNELLKD